jgi:hypothetical protein
MFVYVTRDKLLDGFVVHPDIVYEFCIDACWPNYLVGHLVCKLVEHYPIEGFVVLLLLYPLREIVDAEQVAGRSAQVDICIYVDMML